MYFIISAALFLLEICVKGKFLLKFSVHK